MRLKSRHATGRRQRRRSVRTITPRTTWKAGGPQDRASRRDGEHYLYAKFACEKPSQFLGVAPGPPTQTQALVALISVGYSLVKDADIYWGLLFPEAGRYLRARDWAAKLDDKLIKEPKYQGAFLRALDGTNWVNSPGTLKEGYWALKGLVDCDVEYATNLIRR